VIAVYAICEALGVPPEEFFRMVSVEMGKLGSFDKGQASK
jgi:hypothetical protein